MDNLTRELPGTRSSGEGTDLAVMAPHVTDNERDGRNTETNHNDDAVCGRRPQEKALESTRGKKRKEISSQHDAGDGDFQPLMTGEEMKNPKAIHSAESLSLKELTQHFVATFCQEDRTEIHLDTVVREFGIKKRRLYDVLCVLSGLDLVEKSGKGTYTWKGYQRLENYLERLRTEVVDDDEMEGSASNNRKLRTTQELTRSLTRLLLQEVDNKIDLDHAVRKIYNITDQKTRVKPQLRRLYDIITVMETLRMVQRTASKEKNSDSGRPRATLHWKGIGEIKVAIANAEKMQEQKLQEIGEGMAGSPYVGLQPQLFPYNGAYPMFSSNPMHLLGDGISGNLVSLQQHQGMYIPGGAGIDVFRPYINLRGTNVESDVPPRGEFQPHGKRIYYAENSVHIPRPFPFGTHSNSQDDSLFQQIEYGDGQGNMPQQLSDYLSRYITPPEQHQHLDEH